MKKNLFSLFFLSVLVLLGCLNTYGQYCVPTMPPFGSGCDFGDGIEDFILTGDNGTSINDVASGCAGPTAYDDQTALPPVELTEGSVYSAIVSSGFSSNYCAIWIDFNDDQTFQTSERVGQSALNDDLGVGSGSSISITIPAGAATGNKRMRVMGAYATQGNLIDPCNNGSNQAFYFEAQDYTVTIVGLNPCTGTPTAGAAQASVSTINCSGDVDLSLSGAGTETGVSYQWETSTDGTNWVTTSGTTETYTHTALNITTQFRCLLTCLETEDVAYSSPVTVTVNGPGVDLGPDQMICPGTTIVLDAGDNATTYTWSNGATTSTITVDTPGIYSVTAVDASGCSMIDAIIIGAGTDPSNNLSAEAEICDGAVYPLNAGNPGATYLWNTGETTQTIDATTSGTYSVTIINEDGCELTTATNLTVHPLPIIDLGEDTTVCDGVLLTLDAENAGGTYLWTTGDTSQTIEVGLEGDYTVTVTSAAGCISSDSFSLTILPQPYVEGFNFVPMFYEELGMVQFAPLLPVAVIGYEWDFGDGSAVDTSANPTHIYSMDGNYLVSLKVTNFCGSYTTAQMIFVDHVTGVNATEHNDIDLKLYPNPATEHIQVVLENTNITINHIRVYNSIGALVYDQAVSGNNQHQISVNHWASGIYTISIESAEGRIIKKFEVLR